MISVFVGTQDKPFFRLIDYIIKAKKDGYLKDEEVLIQTGQTKYNFDSSILKNYNIKIFDFKKEEEIEEIIKKSNYIISHSGVGLLMNAIKLGKKVIIVPRLKKYKEHVNDHQIQIAENFEKEEYGIVVKDYTEFINALNDINSFKQKEYKSNNENFCNKLDKLIIELVNKK